MCEAGDQRKKKTACRDLNLKSTQRPVSRDVTGSRPHMKQLILGTEKVFVTGSPHRRREKGGVKCVPLMARKRSTWDLVTKATCCGTGTPASQFKLHCSCCFVRGAWETTSLVAHQAANNSSNHMAQNMCSVTIKLLPLLLQNSP